MSDPAQPSGSRVTAPPPEPSEAMVEVKWGGKRRLTFDNGRYEDFYAILVWHKESGGWWDQILVKRSEVRARQVLAALAVSPGCRGAEHLAEVLAEERRAVQRGSFPPQEMEALFEAVHATDEALKALQAGGPGRGAELAEAVQAAYELLVTIEPTTDIERATVASRLLAAFRASGEAGPDCPVCGPDDCDPELHREAEWRAETGSRDPQGPPIGWRSRRRSEP